MLLEGCATGEGMPAMPLHEEGVPAGGGHNGGDGGDGGDGGRSVEEKEGGAAEGEGEGEGEREGDGDGGRRGDQDGPVGGDARDEDGDGRGEGVRRGTPGGFPHVGRHWSDLCENPAQRRPQRGVRRRPDGRE